MIERRSWLMSVVGFVLSPLAFCKKKRGHSVGIDPGEGSSQTSVAIVRIPDGKIESLQACHFEQVEVKIDDFNREEIRRRLDEYHKWKRRFSDFS